jgi:hypothetical protein
MTFFGRFLMKFRLVTLVLSALFLVTSGLTAGCTGDDNTLPLPPSDGGSGDGGKSEGGDAAKSESGDAAPGVDAADAAKEEGGPETGAGADGAPADGPTGDAE